MGSKAKAREKSGLRRLSELRYRLYFKEIRGKTPRLSSKSLLLTEDNEPYLSTIVLRAQN
jgi:hypothetical protein